MLPTVAVKDFSHQIKAKAEIAHKNDAFTVTPENGMSLSRATAVPHEPGSTNRKLDRALSTTNLSAQQLHVEKQSLREHRLCRPQRRRS